MIETLTRSESIDIKLVNVTKNTMCIFTAVLGSCPHSVFLWVCSLMRAIDEFFKLETNII